VLRLRVPANMHGFRDISTRSIGLGAALLLVIAAGMFWWARSPEPLPDFAALDDAQARKVAFFRFLAPRIEDVNARILRQRGRLLEIVANIEAERALRGRDRRWLAALAREYEVEWDPEAPESAIEVLTLRVGPVPAALALVQAAVESGWGRSRFAVEGNNLFGHWCYEPGCGLVPDRRGSDARHEVAAFRSVRESVARYLHNLNTHPAHRAFRERRARLDSVEGIAPALALADGLMNYSERREDYVAQIRAMLEANREDIEQVAGAGSV